MGLEVHGLDPAGTVIWRPSTSQLYEHALKRGDARLAEGSQLAVDTGVFTGRSPQDKYVVSEPGSRDRIWWGEINHPLPEERFDRLPRGSSGTSTRRIRSMSSTRSPAPMPPIGSPCG